MNDPPPIGAQHEPELRGRLRERMVQGCPVSCDPGGRVADFVPRSPLPDLNPTRKTV